VIDLEFDNAGEAEAAHAPLRALWGSVKVMQNPRARTVEAGESREY
jgi:hypothetical protein